MLRSLLSWLVVFALLVAGFGATVLALNGDVFSAHGFVRSYLQALESRDADAALAFAGVDVPELEGSALLVDDALAGIGGIRLLSDVADDDGLHAVRFAYVVDDEEHVSTFHVERDGTTLALFSRWRFASPPLASLDVTVDHDSRFTVNGVPAVAGSPLLVLAPGLYELDHDTVLLSAQSQTVIATELGGTVAATIEVQPTPAFDAAAQDAVAAYLDDCATQQLLMPTGCPFGFEEANRVVGVPRWTIQEHPVVTLGAGDASTWIATGSGGSARIAVTVRSLFDGSQSLVDDVVGFRGSYVLAISSDDTVTVLESSP